MYKLFKIILTIILFLISLNYTNEIIIYFQKKDPIMKEIINKQDDYYIKPIDAIITKNFVIKEVNGRKINIKKSYQKMKKLGFFNENLLVYEKVLPNVSYLDKYDKVIIPRYHINNISLIFEIDNNESLFYNINNILKENDIESSILKNNFIYDNKTYINKSSLNYCISFDYSSNKDCINNEKYTLLIKGEIISSNFLNNTKKAIDNHNNIIIYRFNVNNLSNLNSIIKYLKSNYYNLVNIDRLIYN